MLNRSLVILLMCWLLMGSTSGFRLGVAPWTNEQLLFSWAEPYRKQLSDKLGVNFILGSGSDHRNYLDKIIAGHFDVMQVPGHLALYLQRYHGFVPVMIMNEQDHGGVLIRRKDFINNLSIHVPDPLTFISFLMTDRAKQQIPILSVVNHRDQWQVLEGLFIGKFGQGVVDQILYMRMNDQMKSQLIEVEQFPDFLPSMIVMPANHDPKMVDDIFNALQNFTPKFKPLFEGVERITPAALARYHADYTQYVQRVNKMMSAKDRLK